MSSRLHLFLWNHFYVTGLIFCLPMHQVYLACIINYYIFSEELIRKINCLMQFIGTLRLQHTELVILKYVWCFGDYSSVVYAFSINILSNSQKVLINLTRYVTFEMKPFLSNRSIIELLYRPAVQIWWK